MCPKGRPEGESGPERVSAKGCPVTVRVQTADFDAGAEIARLRAGDARVGAVATFIGTVRDVNDDASVARLGLQVVHHEPAGGDAFDACRFVMDYLKTRAPFWKKERTPDGERWVEARASDDEAASRW